jgi:hypothetical protein
MINFNTKCKLKQLVETNDVLASKASRPIYIPNKRPLSKVAQQVVKTEQNQLNNRSRKTGFWHPTTFLCGPLKCFSLYLNPLAIKNL